MAHPFLSIQASDPFLIFEKENNQFQLRITENLQRLFSLCSECQIHHPGLASMSSTSVPSDNQSQVSADDVPELLGYGFYKYFYLLCYGCAFPPTIWFSGRNFTSLRNVRKFSNGMSRVHAAMGICSYLFTFLGFLFFPI